MSGQWDNDGPAMKFGLPVKLWMIIILMFLCIFSLALLPKSVPFVNPQIKAEPYVWPQGCAKREYNELDKIDKECLADNYYIGDGEQWGWPRSSKRSNYYRLENDAMDMGCNMITQNCYASHIVKKVFITSNRYE